MNTLSSSVVHLIIAYTHKQTHIPFGEYVIIIIITICQLIYIESKIRFKHQYPTLVSIEATAFRWPLELNSLFIVRSAHVFGMKHSTAQIKKTQTYTNYTQHNFRLVYEPILRNHLQCTQHSKLTHLLHALMNV